jgi:F-type H+-transporting ATPase subunit a
MAEDTAGRNLQEVTDDGTSHDGAGPLAAAGGDHPEKHTAADHHGESASHDPLSPEELIGHVKDADYFHVPRAFARETHGHVPLPQIRESREPIVEVKVGFAPIDELIEPLDLHVTKFMVLEVVAALIIAALFIPLAQRVRTGQRPRGRLWNLLEAMVVFIRDQVARPTIGSHDADRFTPFILTLFFFVLGCNLLGLVPWAGSPTGALATTGALALITFGTVIMAGSLKLGPVGFWLAQVPKMDLPWYMAILLKPMIFGIEVLGIFIKHFVLAMRLLANMLAGHVVLAVLIAFIAASAGELFFYGVVPASLLGATALNMLELFVAFLQAYIFAFLSGLFIGMAVHPH